ncbi:MAG: NAD-dependent succinate-semialdehyde dehydrogenase [Candidatus Hydrogenedentes bacterium]|nr:NAD-dependent succinate-semialdehyde dehydrogenase [Candidatus Hydrogenedentota bacterium]
MGFEAINPATGETFATYDAMSGEEANRIVTLAHEAFHQWRRVSFEERAQLFRRAAEVLRDRKQAYGEIMVREMGQTISSATAEVDKCAWVCEYYADNAAMFLKPRIVESDASKSFVSYQPLGVLLSIMPWNFPFWQVFRQAAPGLMAGNTSVLKHASNVPGSALAIEEVFRDAGFPENVFRTILVRGRDMDSIIANPLIRQVSLTGSTPAGQSVGATAAKHLKKTVLELGGSDPYIILEDADIDLAATTCAASRLICSGQSCIAAKRFIVVEAVLDAFSEKFVEAMRSKKVGDPMDPATEVGPLARHDLRDELHDQVKRSIDKGARCVLGGEIPEGPGAYYPPTVLTDVTKGMPAHDDELFGPVAAIIRAKDEAEAIEIANDSIFGLGSAVFTQDVERGERIATTELDAGCAFVNSFVKSDPRLPFGGVKESGYGRELGIHGIHELVNIKTVYIK